MEVSLSCVIRELGVSLTASAIIALMVLAGGMALESTVGEAAVARQALQDNGEHPLTVCRDDLTGFRCIQEAS